MPLFLPSFPISVSIIMSEVGETPLAVKYSDIPLENYSIAFNLEHLDDIPNIRNAKYKSCSDHLCCAICQQPFVQPLTTVCGHTFCKECIYEFLRVQHQRSSRGRNTDGEQDEDDTGRLLGSCPLDRTPLDSSNINELFPTPLIISNLVDELEVYCLNHERGCTWTGCRWELDRHVLSNCGYTGVACKGYRTTEESVNQEEVGKLKDICKLLVERRLFEDATGEERTDNDHDRECIHKVFECSLCQAEITKIDQETHLQNSCPYNYTKCSLCFNDMIPLMNLAKHEENCGKAGHLKCPAHEIGCDWVGNSETSLEIHLQNNNCQLSKLLPYMKNLSGKIEDLSQENSLLHRQINKILDLIIQGKVTNLGYHEPMEEINRFSSELSSIENQDKLLFLNCELNRLKFELDNKILPFINRESTSRSDRESILNDLVNDNFMMKDDLNLQRALVNSLRKQLQFMLFKRSSPPTNIPGLHTSVGGIGATVRNSVNFSTGDAEHVEFFDIPSSASSEERLNLKL